jgi:hypothetical protein
MKAAMRRSGGRILLGDDIGDEAVVLRRSGSIQLDSPV